MSQKDSEAKQNSTESLVASNKDVQWDCQVDRTTLTGAKANEIPVLTVGDLFLLRCDGESQNMNRQKLEFKVEKQDLYKLKLLEVRHLSETQGEFIVTSYRTGDHQLSDLVLTDTESSVRLDGVSFSVSSVINPEQAPEGPYGPFGPFHLSLSLWVWLVLAAFILIVMGLFLNRYRKFRQKKRLLLKLQHQGMALSPLAQFHKDVRLLHRDYLFDLRAFYNESLQKLDENRNLKENKNQNRDFSVKKYIEQLDLYFRQFIGRELYIPALDWSDGDILLDIKKNHRLFFTKNKTKLKILFTEIAKAKENEKTLKPADFEQLVGVCRKMAEKVVQREKR